MHPNEARKYLNEALRLGRVSILGHAAKRMIERGIGNEDIKYVLKVGRISNPELENGSWRYRVTCEGVVVVVAFEMDSNTVVVTVWRNE